MTRYYLAALLGYGQVGDRTIGTAKSISAYKVAILRTGTPYKH